MWQDSIKIKGFLGLSRLRSIPLNPTYVDLCQKLYTPVRHRNNLKINLTFIRVMVTLLPALGKGVWCYENVICFQKGS